MRTVQPSDDGKPWPGFGVVLAGRYRLEQYLAAGSAASLWRAIDERLDRPVTIKILLPHHVRDAATTERFRREAMAIATVRSPHVVRIFDMDQHTGVPLLVMEYVDGPTLSAFRGRALDDRMAAALGYQTASALAAVHAQGLVHRDVKPSNIVFESATGRVKLLDFGITKNLAGQTELTGPHDLVATVGYAAPEQVAGDEVGPWSDVYSLGLVLWELCTGRQVFEAETTAETVLARTHHDPPPVTDRRPTTGSALVEVIQRATRRDHHARYPDGRAFAEALAGLCDALPHALTRRLVDGYRPDAPASPGITPEVPAVRHAAGGGIATTAAGSW